MQRPQMWQRGEMVSGTVSAEKIFVVRLFFEEPGTKV
jgi:hypothetical protein